jgi:hypothetical protein
VGNTQYTLRKPFLLNQFVKITINSFQGIRLRISHKNKNKKNKNKPYQAPLNIIWGMSRKPSPLLPFYRKREMDTKNRNFRNTAWKSRSLYTFLLLKCFS